jgi:hypothetical protein
MLVEGSEKWQSGLNRRRDWGGEITDLVEGKELKWLLIVNGFDMGCDNKELGVLFWLGALTQKDNMDRYRRFERVKMMENDVEPKNGKGERKIGLL